MTTNNSTKLKRIISDAKIRFWANRYYKGTTDEIESFIEDEMTKAYEVGKNEQ